jgi:hypothetical protein
MLTGVWGTLYFEAPAELAGRGIPDGVKDSPEVRGEIKDRMAICLLVLLRQSGSTGTTTESTGASPGHPNPIPYRGGERLCDSEQGSESRE